MSIPFLSPSVKVAINTWLLLSKSYLQARSLSGRQCHLIAGDNDVRGGIAYPQRPRPIALGVDTSKIVPSMGDLESNK